LVSPSIVVTSFFLTIVNISWFWGWAYHLMIHRLFYHFVFEILWHLGSLALELHKVIY
jgi:hypothetical protein